MLFVISILKSYGCTHQCYLLPRPARSPQGNKASHILSEYTLGLTDGYQIHWCSPYWLCDDFFIYGIHKLIICLCSYGMKNWWDRSLHILQFKELLPWELSSPWNSEQKAVMLGMVWLASPLDYFLALSSSNYHGSTACTPQKFPHQIS